MSDVCLILEGTYPYVTGGVSTCVYQLIKETPHVNYSIVYIGAKRMTDLEYKYPIPENVRLIREVYLYDYDIKGDIRRGREKFEDNPLSIFHQMMMNKNDEIFPSVFSELFNRQYRRADPLKILESEYAWSFLEEMYMERFPGGMGVSFLDFFYHWRFTYFPIFQVLATDIPKADIYHCLCTGYAGLMGVAAKLQYNKPLVVTEHGIYTHEREIEVYQADWIYNTDKDLKAKDQLGFFKEWWISMFHFMGKLAYENADTITTLHEVNKQKQIHYGAPEEKIRMIPNGIKVEKFEEIRNQEAKSDEFFTLALIGRVVSIKDIKTFIKAVNYAYSQNPKVRAYILGPEEEEPEYASECHQLVSMLGLDDIITFTGKVDIMDYLGKIDVIALTSISEGQPMVILEAYACSIPVITTDVGGCRELIEGGEVENEKIGASGLCVPFGNSKLFGEAILKLIYNPELLKEYSENAFKRVDQYYREEISITNYETIYRYFLGRTF